MSIITLLTDFGPDDTYVASLKGVILGINPQATLVDITHTVPPQDVLAGAYLLGCAYRDFPPGTVHLAVVDPGVGSSRRAIACRAGGHTFVGPDNGLLSYVLDDCGAITPLAGSQTHPHPNPLPSREREVGRGLSKGHVSPVGPQPHRGRAGVPSPLEGEGKDEGVRRSPDGLVALALPRGVRAVELTAERFWRQPVSPTFHGRDIFAPVAAHLSPSAGSGQALGVPLARMGRRLSELLAFPIPRPQSQPDGSVLGEVIHVDRFGNLITNLRHEDLPPRGLPVFTLTLPSPRGRGLQKAPSPAGRGPGVRAATIRGLARSYADAPADLLAIVGSSGRIEIALRNGSAASRLGVGMGTVVGVVSESNHTFPQRNQARRIKSLPH